MSKIHKGTIIALVVVKKDNKYLLIQESKVDCYGKWYLPAGRVEKNESLITAAKREVEEESGYKINLNGLFRVGYLCRSKNCTWIRFSFRGIIESGELKTIGDKESLGASWFAMEEIEKMLKEGNLRNKDMMDVLEEEKKGKEIEINDFTEKYLESKKRKRKTEHSNDNMDESQIKKKIKENN